jgi:YfiH family protein
VLLADPAAGVVGAAHAGRNGLALGVVPRAVEQLRAMGAERLTAWVGPHVCGGCYEVPAAMRDEVAARVPSSYSETTWGTPSIDVGAGVRAQLAEAGVEDVHVVERCTREDEGLYSYRRDGDLSGRLAGLVWMQA